MDKSNKSRPTKAEIKAAMEHSIRIVNAKPGDYSPIEYKGRKFKYIFTKK